MEHSKSANSKLRWIIVLMLFTFSFGYSQTEKPNIIIINVDDLGYGDIGVQGATKVKTPNINKLAVQGKRFTDFHSASAVCSPSRYALITGRYPARSNLYYPIFLKTPIQIETDRMTLGSLMKKADYQTAIIGKWHLGFGNESPVDWNKPLKPGPLELGFDYYFGVPILNSHPPFVYVENHDVVGLVPEDPFVYGKKAETRFFDEKMGIDEIGGAKAAHQNYNDRMVGTTLKEKAVEWIKAHKEKPFFLYFATTNIHHPFTPAPRFIGTSEAGPYGDFIHELDWMLSEIMNTLDEEGISDNTLVIFTSDNGGMLNRGGQFAREAGHHANGAYLGFKFDAWEGGHRVPFIARWPGKIVPGSTSDQMFSNVDLFATLAAVIGYQPKKDEGPDSVNMLPALIGDPKEPIRENMVIAAGSRNHLSLRKGKWMFIPAQGGGGFGAKHLGDHDFGGAAAFPFTEEINSDIEDGQIKETAAMAQLYNLETDPYESTNVYNQNPKVVAEMEALLKEIITKKQ
ncbi:sulfatase family protein [Winogradskyella schleiferi]|uniref:sulfatase family protein n=1 Tax=Winogradskyella schleiferi TaxID=2686078 RepID=UPI001E2E392D|nr:arylsulfatase [Winogradskyella schleiferi]